MLIFMIVFVAMSIIVGQTVANCTSRRTSQSCADQATGRTTNAVANYLTAHSPKPSSNS